MRSQWECLCANIGLWQGQFMKINPAGEVLSAQPSQTTLQLLPDGLTMHQKVKVGASETNLTYGTLARSVLFFEEGAFSQGSTQYTPVGEFGAELGLIAMKRRLRLVLIYQKSILTEITLIPEHLTDVEPIHGDRIPTDCFYRKHLGQGTVRYPDGSTQKSIAYERSRDMHNQADVLFLPFQTIVVAPQQIPLRQPFDLQVFWQIAPHTFLRMVRAYDRMGGWYSLQLSQERSQEA